MDQSPFALHNLTFSVDKKAKVGICGPAGSGKTSLLNALMGCVSFSVMFRCY